MVQNHASEVCGRTFRYIYMHVCRFDSCAQDLEKSGNFICLESGCQLVYMLLILRFFSAMDPEIQLCLQCFEAVGWAAGRESGL